MKKTIFLLSTLFVLASCEKDCQYSPDHATIKAIEAQIVELQQKRDTAPSEALAALYQKQIEQLVEEMKDELKGPCN